MGKRLCTFYSSVEYYFVFSERRGTSLSIPQQSPHILLQAADYWEWTPQKPEPALQQTMLLCKTIQSDSYNLFWEKWNLLFLFCWQWLCLHRQTVQRRRSRAAEKNTQCSGLSSDMTCIFKDFKFSIHLTGWLLGARCTRQTHGIVFLIWAYLHLNPGQKWVCQLPSLTVLQFTLQMASGCKEWTCIELINSYSGQDHKSCKRKDEIKTNKNWTATGSVSGWKAVSADLIHSDIWGNVMQHARKAQPVANNVDMISSSKKTEIQTFFSDFFLKADIFSALLFNCRTLPMAKVFKGKYN